MSYKSQCTECKSSFIHNKNLYAHLRKIHKLEPILFKKSVPKFSCSDCSKLFCYKSTLAKHRRLHDNDSDYPKSEPRKSRLLCPHNSCDRRLTSYAVLRSHLKDEHYFKVEEENHQFDSLKSLEAWKSKVEQQTFSLYTRDSSPKLLAKDPGKKSYIHKIYYNCHRSHFFRPMGRGVRCPKSVGSNKIGKACPSRIEVCVTQSEEKPLIVNVKFWKSHCGHELQLRRICLDGQTRADIAEKLQEGESFDQILDSVKDPHKSQDVNPRLSLLKRKDLHNIVRDFNVNYSSKGHNKETVQNEEGYEETKVPED